MTSYPGPMGTLAVRGKLRRLDACWILFLFLWECHSVFVQLVPFALFDTKPALVFSRGPFPQSYFIRKTMPRHLTFFDEQRKARVLSDWTFRACQTLETYSFSLCFRLGSAGRRCRGLSYLWPRVERLLVLVWLTARHL